MKQRERDLKQTFVFYELRSCPLLSVTYLAFLSTCWVFVIGIVHSKIKKICRHLITLISFQTEFLSFVEHKRLHFEEPWSPNKIGPPLTLILWTVIWWIHIFGWISPFLTFVLALLIFTDPSIGPESIGEVLVFCQTLFKKCKLMKSLTLSLPRSPNSLNLIHQIYLLCSFWRTEEIACPNDEGKRVKNTGYKS